MNKGLGFIVLFAFLFSSCATAPVEKQSQKLSAQVRVYPLTYLNGGYTNNSIFALMNNNFFGILDVKASDSTDGSESDVKVEQSSSGSNALITVLQLGVLAVGGYLIYDYFTNPDAILKK
jgi:hypothetical protein